MEIRIPAFAPSLNLCYSNTWKKQTNKQKTWAGQWPSSSSHFLTAKNVTSVPVQFQMPAHIHTKEKIIKGNKIFFKWVNKLISCLIVKVWVQVWFCEIHGRRLLVETANNLPFTDGRMYNSQLGVQLWDLCSQGMNPSHKTSVYHRVRYQHNLTGAYRTRGVL